VKVFQLEPLSRKRLRTILMEYLPSFLYLQLKKPSKIRMGNWETPFLSKEQLEYAATDAFASWFLYQVLWNSLMVKIRESNHHSSITLPYLPHLHPTPSTIAVTNHLSPSPLPPSSLLPYALHHCHPPSLSLSIDKSICCIITFQYWNHSNTC
jgi:hypothetical protein